MLTRGADKNTENADGCPFVSARPPPVAFRLPPTLAAGISAVLAPEYAAQRDEFLRYLQAAGVENRPIISGNFTRQPCIKLFMEGADPADYPGAEVLHTRGFFIGVHQLEVPEADMRQLVSIMMEFSWKPSRAGEGGAAGSSAAA